MIDVDFLYAVFQPCPPRNIVWYWLDPQKQSYKRVSKIDSFIEFVENKNRKVLPQMKEALCTYSFWMWNQVDNRVILLHPSDAQDRTYRDPLASYFKKGLKGQDPFAPEEQDPLSHLYKLGFQMPNEDDIKNLRVRMTPTKQKSFLARIGNILPGNTSRKK